MAGAFKNVILGGGNAAGYAAREFVKHGLGKDVCLISEEDVLPYERPALSKAYLFPEGSWARLPGFHTCVGGGGERQDQAWYDSNGVKTVLGCTATSVDVKAKKIETTKGTFTFENLIYATGCGSTTLADFKTPGADLENVLYLRDVKDADKINAAVQAVKAAGGKVVCVGGGYIGMETAAAISKHGVDITMVFPEPHMMARLFDASMAEWYAEQYAKHNIKLVKGDLVVGLEAAPGTTKVGTAKLKSGGTLPADLVVVGVGARPRVQLLEGQVALEAGGVKVDGQMKACEGVYAVGDVAAFPLLRHGGKIVRQEHVTHARASAIQAVNAIVDPKTPAYDYLPFFYSRVFDLSWQFYGDSAGSIVHFGDRASKKWGAYWVDGGKVVGAFLEGGSPEDNALMKKVAVAQPAAPADLADAGLSFAAKL